MDMTAVNDVAVENVINQYKPLKKKKGLRGLIESFRE